MVTTREGERLNGLDIAELSQYIDDVKAEAAKADRNPDVIARWVGGTRAEVTSALGGPPVYIGGDHDPGAMGMLLRALAACDIEVIVTRATLMGIEIQDLSIEAKGFFNVAPYLGVETPEGAGYQLASMEVQMRTKGTPPTPEQVDGLRAALHASPVGDTLRRHVPVTIELRVTS